jgi:hypothetical protein
MVDWTNSRWTLLNMVEEEMNISSICQIPKPRDVLFPQLRTMSESRLLCNKLKGQMTLVDSAETQEKLNDMFQKMLPDRISG